MLSKRILSGRLLQVFHRVIFLLLMLILMGSELFATPRMASAPRRHPEFIVVDALRPRVNFWINVFANYGKYQSIIHHRDYPQITFKVLDFSAQGKSLSAVQFDLYKSKEVRREIAIIHTVLKKLASGAKPSNKLEQNIADHMSRVPGGISKYNEAIKKELIRSQTGIREKFEASVARSGRYLPAIERIFSDYDLPIELTRLPYVESSFDYTAYSSVGAAGIWQFMPRTAKLYGMIISAAVDERRDPLRATIGAARYLQDAYKRLDAWPLALTSYNHGVYGVIKAVRKMGTKDIAKIVEAPASERVFGFASNNFYVEFLAALEVSERAKQIFPGVVIEPPLQFDQIKLSVPHSVKFIETRLGVSRDQIATLNYGISKATLDGRYKIPSGYTLKVPVGFGRAASKLEGGEPDRYATLVESSASSIYGGITYTVRKGDTLDLIARKYRVSVSALKASNGLSSNVIRVGQKLKVKGNDTTKNTTPPSSATKTPIAPKVSNPAPAARLTYKVQTGDSLWTIARKFGVSVEAIKKSNKLVRSGIKPGQQIKIP